jgi:DNA-binding CsgD family transcriptional regulator
MLVGREPERQRLGALLQQARSAVSATCVVRGEAGIGKSALLDDVMADADGWEVLRARGVVTESELSFAVLNDLLRPLRSRFARLPERQRAALDGALGTGPPTGADAFTVAVAVLAVVSGAAEDRPLLVCLDDCQWVDLPSLQCLTFVARRLQADQVLILLATRTWPTRGPLPSALEGFESLDLGRLPPADAERLLDRSAPGLPALERTAVLDRAKGHPLALLELARSPGFLDQSPLVPASWRLEDVFTDELARLPTRCREVLELLGVLGGSAPDVFALLLEDVGGSLSDLEPAEEAGLVVLDQGAVHFRHPLIELATYHAIGPSRRRALHLRVAGRLAGATRFSDLERRTWHRVAGTVERNEDLAQELESLAHEAVSRSSAPSAVHLLRQAAQLSPTAAQRSVRLLAAAEQVQSAGLLDQADELLEEAAECATTAEAGVAVEHLRCRFDMWRGQPVLARNRLLRLAATVDVAAPVMAAVMYGHAALTGVWLGDLRGAAAAIEAAEQLAPPSPVPLLAVLAPAALLDLLSGHDARGRARLVSIREAGGLDPLGTEQLPLVVALGLFADGEVEAALTLVEETVMAARAHAAVGLLPFQLPRLAMLQFAAGRWHAAMSSATEAVEAARYTGWVTELPAAHAVLALIAAGHGRADECRASAAVALEGARRAGAPMVAAQAQLALGVLELSLGRPREAQRYLELVAAFAQDCGLVENSVVSWLPDLVECHVRTGDAEAARAGLAELAEAVARGGRIRLEAAYARCRGLAAQATDEAEDELKRSAALAERAGAPFEQARSLLGLGQLYRRDRRRGTARKPLAAALAIFEYLGAESWAEQVRVELNASGVEVERKAVDLSRLSPQEMCVAAAAAEGLSNQQTAMRLFLSVRTVEFHLSNAYRKLGISRRAQLVRLISAPG